MKQDQSEQNIDAQNKNVKNKSSRKTNIRNIY